MNKLEKGKIAELKVELAAYEKGWAVSRPMSNTRYDLILDDGKKLYRAQVKYAGSKPSKSDGAAWFSANNGPHSPATYSKDEIDVILAYIPQIDKIVWIGPNEFDGKGGFSIRYEAPKNGQKKGLFLAEEHIWN